MDPPTKRRKIEWPYDDLPKEVLGKLFGAGEAQRGVLQSSGLVVWIINYGPFSIRMWSTNAGDVVLHMTSAGNASNDTWELVNHKRDFDDMCKAFSFRIYVTELAHIIRIQNRAIQLDVEAQQLFI